MNLNIWWHTVVRNQPATEWTKLLLPNDIMLSSDYSWIIFNLLSYHLIRRHLDSPMPIAAEMPDKYMKEQWICVTFIQEQMFPVTKLRNTHHNWWDINLQSATEHTLNVPQLPYAPFYPVLYSTQPIPPPSTKIHLHTSFVCQGTKYFDNYFSHFSLSCQCILESTFQMPQEISAALTDLWWNNWIVFHQAYPKNYNPQTSFSPN